MDIIVKRSPTANGCTIGQLFINGKFECFTLEDPVREQKGVSVDKWKVAGNTAIPSGTYNVIVSLSSRFKRDLPLVENVPGFAGIRIHRGNTAADTEGCLLVGTGKTANSVTNSRAAFDVLFPKIKAAFVNKEKITIHYVNA